MHPNKAIVAVAAKIARIAWEIITKPGALYERKDQRFAYPRASRRHGDRKSRCCACGTLSVSKE